ncbi:ribonuclease E/G [Altererythrobacter sp. CC-YST694]|uniref:Rne/Rng family ribonuclease n=1 Tax=Altererythrobacter sp. CC-YST694 TaxID=2755038 RepID=UPI001D02D3CC|nr:ribonuclease E/G [Altererythrobacter sp. CC-YST694]MCB5424612.1 ribonuclease E/G [Altererythrobacter sp. CC-YST694]
MATRMLIDARHPEETRVAVLKGNRIEEFDFESAEHKQIKGNIYLAKVTRVEPSLQAAFVDFGGNRHGFLAFSEIHPDYYQIPREDREALLAEEAEAAAEEAALRAAEEEEEDALAEESEGDAFADEMAGEDGVEEIDTSEKDDVATIEGGEIADGDEEDGEGNADDGVEGAEDGNKPRRGRRQGRGGNRARAKEVDEVRAKRMALRRRYKIQDVIHRRQVLLVQVVKEERGNKGAALTTYLSLAGRYCVLMPNSTHGGGISRKISNASDRKRLKQIVAEMKLPKSMGCIVRTAGLQRTKPEIKRDFDYLARLWDEIRENTLKSAAPTLIHSDSDLVKRAIRDIYNRDIEEVVVEGELGYKAARDFMKLLMPSHARRVKAYSDPVPLFQRYGAEDQLTAMYDPVVQLRSGGYIVINPTEALVSIDINSGRSTKEHGIEQTALATNLEAAHEIARQLRLRDMAGLVVIDFIDMEYNSNIRKVERAMKDALKHDRARIQVGRISGFGLMEMSRQRLRTGVLEATTRSCPHCDGTGLVRTASSAGLSALRLIEDEAAKGKGTIITLYASTEASIYLLNAKRADLHEIEDRYGVTVQVIPEGENEGAKMRVVSGGPRPTSLPKFEPIVDEIEEEEELEAFVDEEEDEEGENDDRNKKRRRRRRGGRGRKRRDEMDEGSDEEREDDESEAGEDSAADEGESDESDTPTDEDGEGSPRKKRRRRGGRNRRKKRLDGEGEGEGEAEGAAQDGESAAEDAEVAEAELAETAEPAAEEAATVEAPVETPKPKARRSRAKKVKEEPATDAETTAGEASVAEPAAAAEEAPPAKPKRTRRKKADAEAEAAAAAEAAVETPAAEVSAEVAPAKPKRTRRKKAEPTAEAPAAEVAAPEAAPAETVAEVATAEPAAPSEPEPAAAQEASPESSASPRRGWWQRTFGE